MAAIDLSNAASGGGGGGNLQLASGASMDTTLRAVTDTSNTASTLKLSTTSAQFVSPLRITTDDPSDFYLDCEDGSTNNRFSITRNTSSQQVNLNFSSNPGGGSAIVGAIRTYVDDVNLSEVVQFREDGRIQIGSTAASAMYWDNTNNRLGVGTNAPTEKITVQTSSVADGISLKDASNQLALIGKWFDSSGFLDLAQNGSAYARIQASQSYLNTSFTVGSTSALSARLGIKGSGSTSATTSLLVQNSSAVNLLTALDNGTITMGNASNSLTIEAGSNAIFHRTGVNYFSNNSGTYYGTLQESGLQIGNGAAAPNASAIVDLTSTTKGFLPPRMTNAQRLAIGTPAVGLMVYCTDVVEGLYVYKSTGWTFII